MTTCQIRVATMHLFLTGADQLLFLAIFSLRDQSKSIGGWGWAGAFGNVVDKKHMALPLHSVQK